MKDGGVVRGAHCPTTPGTCTAVEKNNLNLGIPSKNWAQSWAVPRVVRATTYLSLCYKNSDLNFLENFTRKVGRGYLPIFSRILQEKVEYLPISNLLKVLIVTYRSKKSNAGIGIIYLGSELGTRIFFVIDDPSSSSMAAIESAQPQHSGGAPGRIIHVLAAKEAFAKSQRSATPAQLAQ